MLKYFSPLWTFVIGMVLTLLMTIFFPAIFTAQSTLAVDPTVTGGNYWGLSQVITSTRLIIFIVCLFITLIATARVWLARKG